MIESRQLNHTNGRRHVFWYLDCAAVKVRKRLYVTKTHCKNIYKKLGIHKREELLVLMEHPSVAPEKDSEEEGAG